MTGLLVLVGALASGILLGDLRGADPAGIPLIGAALLLAGAFVCRERRVAALAAATIAMVLLGSAVEQRALQGLVVSPLAGPLRDGRSVDLVVTLTEDPSGPRYATEALGRVDAIDGRGGGGRLILLAASGDEQSVLRVLEAGDRARLRGRLEPLSGYTERLRWRHAVGVMRIERTFAVADPSDPWYSVANRARAAVLRGSAVLPPTPRALLAGFVLGDTRAVPADLVDDFRAAGLSHLLAVSGANVAFVLAIAAPLFARFRLAGRLAGGVTVLVLFGTMTRWEPSVLRASVMAGAVMLARFLGRPADSRRVLLVAVMVLLVADPFLLHSIGFLLSCAACAGIVVGATPIAARLRGPGWLRDALGVTLAAQLGVAPVLLATFGTVPLVALPANLVAVPFVGPLTIWGIVAAVVGGIVGPGPALWLQLPTLAMLRAVELIAGVAAQVPLAVDGAEAVGLVVVLGGAALVMRWRRVTGRLARRGRRVPREGIRSDPARP